MMARLISTHNVSRTYHKSCWRQPWYCAGSPGTAVSVFGKKSDAVCGFWRISVGFAVFGPPLRPLQNCNCRVKKLLKLQSTVQFIDFKLKPSSHNFWQLTYCIWLQPQQKRCRFVARKKSNSITVLSVHNRSCTNNLLYEMEMFHLAVALITAFY